MELLGLLEVGHLLCQIFYQMLHWRCQLLPLLLLSSPSLPLMLEVVPLLQHLSDPC
jgi:hypothetical protein